MTFVFVVPYVGVEGGADTGGNGATASGAFALLEGSGAMGASASG